MKRIFTIMNRSLSNQKSIKKSQILKVNIGRLILSINQTIKIKDNQLKWLERHIN